MKKILFSFALAILSLCAYAQRDVTTAVTRFGQTLYYINNLYLDTVNFQKIANQAIIAALGELDPHSSFISAEDVKAMNEQLQSEFDGVGIEFAIIHDTLTVQSPVAGGPCEKVGILAGDKILSVNGENIAHISLTNEKVYKYLRGKKGTKVDMTISREGEKSPLHFTVVRDRIPLYSVDAVYQPKDGFLYIKLSRFAATSHDEIIKAIDECKAPVKGIILDLRSNSGGYLDAAIQISNDFLEKGSLIVYTEGKSKPKMSEYADGKGRFKNGPLVVMIDENSASASEIVAGAVQDNDRGIVIGRRSFGKGLVQQVLPLSDGSVIRLTIARYHTPSGRVIQAPYEKGNTEQYYTNFYERFAHGESFSRDSIHFPDSLKYKTIKTGRTVFGGGGIMPDVFIPQDTSGYSQYYASLIRRGVVVEYVNAMCDRNRSSLISKYPNFEKFDKKFSVSSEIINEVVNLAETKGIKPNPAQLKTSEKEIKTYIKALMAGNLFSRDNFYKVINGDEPIMLKAVDIMEQWDKYSKELRP